MTREMLVNGCRTGWECLPGNDPICQDKIRLLERKTKAKTRKKIRTVMDPCDIQLRREVCYLGRGASMQVHTQSVCLNFDGGWVERASTSK